MNLRQPFTRIKEGYSQNRQLPRLGKIRLGIKVEKFRPNTNDSVQYPKETEHFVVPPEVEAVYGPTPTELDVMFPLDDPEVVFVQKLARYGASAGLKCHGDGEHAKELIEGTREWKDIPCPCPHRKTDKNPKGDCTEQSSLMVLLPKVAMGGCYQITSRSYHTTVSLNSALDYIRALAGRIALIPLKLRREARDTHHDGKKQTHYTLNLILDATLPQLQQLRTDPVGLLIPAQYQIEGPVDENPVDDDPDEVIIEDADDPNAAKLAHVQAGENGKKAAPPAESVEGSVEGRQDVPAWYEDTQAWKDWCYVADSDHRADFVATKKHLGMAAKTPASSMPPDKRRLFFETFTAIHARGDQQGTPA